MIDKSTIEQVRQRTSLVGTIGERVKLQRRGRSFVGLCPFHKERTPSFHVNEELGYFHCFGCRAKGDVISFVQETEGLSFTEAITQLAERAGIAIVDTRNESERRQAAETRRRGEELYEVGNVAAGFFERALLHHPLSHYAREELLRRDLDPLTSDEPARAALKAFRIGYAPHAWDELTQHLKQQGVSLSAAEKVGLVSPRKSGSGYYDRFRHRLMFAVLDLRGRVIAFSGRALEEPTRAESERQGLTPSPDQEPPAKYINSPESPIYQKRATLFGLFQARNAVRDRDDCTVVEGNFDVVSLHARGLCHAVAPLGTAFTSEQSLQIRRYSQNVTLLFDADKAGRRAVRASREACHAAGLRARVATLPEGKDPDQMIREAGVPALESCLGAAQNMLEYLIRDSLDSGLGAAGAELRAAKINEVAELIKSEEDPTVRAMAEGYADTIAERLGIADARTFRALSARVRQATQQGASVSPAVRVHVAAPEAARSPDRRADIGREILGALLDFRELTSYAEPMQRLAALGGELGICVAALQAVETPLGPDDVAPLLAKFPERYRNFSAQRLAAPKHTHRASALDELTANIALLERATQKQQNQKTLGALERAAASGDHEEEDKLLRELRERARERRGL